MLLTNSWRPDPSIFRTGFVREAGTPYGSPPDTSPVEVAHKLVDAWHALSRAESAVALAEGDTLRLVADQRIHVRLGFSSFHDFCVEAAELTASTAKRRVAVARLAAEFPALRDALLEGTVSQCQALALRPIVTSESAAWWIALAGRSTVTELRVAVRQAAAVNEDWSAESSTGESSPAADSSAAASDSTASSSASFDSAESDSAPFDSAASDSAASSSASFDSAESDSAPFDSAASDSAASSSAESCAANDLFEEEPEGKRVSISAPIAARLAFEEGLEAARLVLGYDAPRHACVAAMLAEVAGNPDAGRSDDGGRNESDTSDRFQSASREGARPADHSKDNRRPAELAPPPAPKAVPPYLRESMKRAQRTVDQVYQQLDSFHELLESAPTEADVADPATMVERLEEIRALSAPIHVLSLRVLLHLEDVSAARYLGARTQNALAETYLGLSPRTFRQLMAEAWQMKRKPQMETAYLSGNVGVSRLRLLGSIEPARFQKFLARARRVTLRQLKRELRFHEKLVVLRDHLLRERSAQERSERERSARQRFAERHEDVARGVRPGPNHNCKDRPPVLMLSERDLDPLPGQDLDAKLACILLQHGHLAQELEENLTRPALCTAEEAASLILRARALASRSSLEYEQRGRDRSRDEADARAGRVPGCARDEADARAGGEPGCARDEIRARAGREAGCARGAVCDHAAWGEFELYQRDPAANPALMRLLETLVDSALLSVCDDSVLVGTQVYPRGRQPLNLEGDFCRISFWAPDTVIEDLHHFLDNVRQRVGPLPAWAALMLLVRDATDVWNQVDRKKKPEFWRIFERDDYLCRVPACSSRRDLHAHHIIFRSQGGSDDPENIAAGCYRHHQHGVHEGHLHCCGNANKALRWVLGPRARRGRPFRIYLGDLRIE